MNEETIYWFSPEQKPETRSVLVMLDGVVYSGVYSPAKDEFLIYPEDFLPEKRTQVEKWTYMPKG